MYKTIEEYNVIVYLLLVVLLIKIPKLATLFPSPSATITALGV